MTPPRAQMLSNMSTRQKVTAAIFIVILLFLFYQIYAMLGGGSSASRTTPPTSTAQVNPNAPGAPQRPQPATPQATQLPRQVAVLSPREMQLLKLQQETEAKYIAALNDLQMLRVEQQIAETNRAIMVARLDTITSQKNIVDLFKPPAPVTTSGYAQNLINPVSSGSPPPATTTTTVTTPRPAAPTAQITPPPQNDITYTVISVSQLQQRWNAVLGFQGNLFSVNVGDFLPPDQSKVVAIDRSGVVLERNGIRKRVSLVPII